MNGPWKKSILPRTCFILLEKLISIKYYKNRPMNKARQSIIHQISHIGLVVFILAQIVVFAIYFNYGRIISLKIIGIIIWIFSVILGWLPIYIFKKKAGVAKGESFVKTSKLIDTGIYGIVRHPQFLGGILLSLAFMLFSQHWLVIVLGIPVVIIFYIGGVEGDRCGVKKFGKEYQDYIKKVPRFNFVLGILRKLKK